MRYGEWIEPYASPEFGALAAVAGPAERTRMAQHYRDSSRFEQLFWEAALRREVRPVQVVAVGTDRPGAVRVLACKRRRYR